MYRPNRTRDYQFLDRIIREQYTVGGLDIYIHRYMGPQAGGEDSAFSGNADATQPTYADVDVLNIQDLLLLENRDRIYDPDVYVMRAATGPKEYIESNYAMRMSVAPKDLPPLIIDEPQQGGKLVKVYPPDETKVEVRARPFTWDPSKPFPAVICPEQPSPS